MMIRDRIYGEYKIKEPVLIELINSKPLQRLKKVAQLGVPDRYYHLKGFSRFEHSLGVMLLLKKLNASLEEQIAGLLHDVSHTAFSHVFDWAFGDQESEDHQDKSHKTFFRNAEIKRILKRHNIDADKTSNIKKFKLLEQEIPKLCADRIDYSLREFHFWANSGVINRLIKHLTNFKGRIAFADFKSAYTFAINFLKCQREHWGGYEAVTRYYLFSSVLKEAIDKKILSTEDFYKDDDFVVSRLIKSKDKKILKTLKMLENKKLPKCRRGIRKIIRKKFRYVDPELIIDGKIKKLSQISNRFRIFLEKQRTLNQKGVKVFLCL